MHFLSRKGSIWTVIIATSLVAVGMFVIQTLGNQPPAWAQSESSLLGVPIGAILPYAGALESLPSNWLPCDGRTVTDPGSPLDGTKLPNLTDDRFLMGVGESTLVGSTGGTNAIAVDGNHSHGGEAGDRVTQKTGSPRYLDTKGNKGFKHSHNLTIRANGRHNHGGDSRPNYYGVRFIIRVR